MSKRIVIVGWFSFSLNHNTAGDLLSMQTLYDWVISAEFDCKVAVPTPVMPYEVETASLIEDAYDAIIFVCGPLTDYSLKPFMDKFTNIKRFAVNVSLIEGNIVGEELNKVFARDSSSIANVDISLATKSVLTPVVGLIYVGKQYEYEGQDHEKVEVVVDETLNHLDCARIFIDTKLPNNNHGLKSSGQIEAVIKKMDVVITTRLHGALLSLRNGVPAVVVDPVPSSAKVSRQMKAIGWPLLINDNELDSLALSEAMSKALKPEYSMLAKSLILQGKDKLNILMDEIVDALNQSL